MRQTDTTGFVKGLLEKPGDSVGLLTGVRVGQHPDYDRIVFQFNDRLPGYKIEYVDRPITQCGSGETVPFPGDAWLIIRFFPANAHTEEGKASVAVREITVEQRNLKQLKQICDFEAVVEWVAAVGNPGRFRVIELTNPARLAVDMR